MAENSFFLYRKLKSYNLNGEMIMLIVVKPYGNHSNRLFQNINFESICYEYHINYINPTFRDMSKFYNKTFNIITLLPSFLTWRRGGGGYCLKY